VKYSIKVSRTGRYDGEYPGANTLSKARIEAKTFLPECRKGRVSIVEFRFGPGMPHNGKAELIEVVHDGT
jgi:hypothetical protein